MKTFDFKLDFELNFSWIKTGLLKLNLRSVTPCVTSGENEQNKAVNELLMSYIKNLANSVKANNFERADLGLR